MEVFFIVSEGLDFQAVDVTRQIFSCLRDEMKSDGSVKN